MQNEDKKQIKLELQKFQALLNREPDPAELDKTPDGRANSFPISFVEMTLDELFFGLWSTENFKWSAIANEVQGSLELVLTHPVTGEQIRRTGAASIIIQVDKAPDNVQGKEKNLWAIDPSNKKANALDLGFPKLKAECLKNAAQTLGKAFGRDINRKKADSYKPLVKDIGTLENTDSIKKLMEDRNVSETFRIEISNELDKMSYTRQNQILEYLNKCPKMFQLEGGDK